METREYELMDKIEHAHFWFVAKRKFLSIVLDKYLPQGGRMLDVGCGTGAVMEFLKSRGEIEGVDMSEEALKYCRAKSLNVRHGLADKIDYPDETFDVVLALDVLEHLDNDGAAINEIHRILKTGGIFIATVPAHKFLWSYHDESLHHKRRYAKKEFEDLLGKQFKVSLVSWIHACIFLPTLIMRGAKKFFGKNTGGSDVKEINNFVNRVGKLCYAPELAYFKFFGGLPFGVSLIGVAVKK
jgi:ubiquinone/menaquinone biosynthesis C-methylase UbiE